MQRKLNKVPRYSRQSESDAVIVISLVNVTDRDGVACLAVDCWLLAVLRSDVNKGPRHDDTRLGGTVGVFVCTLPYQIK